MGIIKLPQSFLLSYIGFTACRLLVHVTKCLVDFPKLLIHFLGILTSPLFQHQLLVQRILDWLSCNNTLCLTFTIYNCTRVREAEPSVGQGIPWNTWSDFLSDFFVALLARALNTLDSVFVMRASRVKRSPHKQANLEEKSKDVRRR